VKPFEPTAPSLNFKTAQFSPSHRYTILLLKATAIRGTTYWCSRGRRPSLAVFWRSQAVHSDVARACVRSLVRTGFQLSSVGAANLDAGRSSPLTATLCRPAPADSLGQSGAFDPGFQLRDRRCQPWPSLL